MAKGSLGQSLVTAVGVASSGDQHGISQTMIAQMVNKMTQLRFSREDESQADQKGLEFMSQAGYDPTAMLHVMEVLKKVTDEQGGRPPEMLQTHPYPESRMEQIKAWLKEKFPNGVSGLADPPLPWVRR